MLSDASVHSRVYWCMGSLHAAAYTFVTVLQACVPQACGVLPTAATAGCVSMCPYLLSVLSAPDTLYSAMSSGFSISLERRVMRSLTMGCLCPSSLRNRK